MKKGLASLVENEWKGGTTRRGYTIMIIDKRDIFSVERFRSNNSRNSYTSQTDDSRSVLNAKLRRLLIRNSSVAQRSGLRFTGFKNTCKVRSGRPRASTHQTLHGKVPGSRAAQGQWVCQILVRRKRSGPCDREFDDLARATRVSPFSHFSTSHILQETLVFRL